MKNIYLYFQIHTVRSYQTIMFDILFYTDLVEKCLRARYVTMCY